MSPPVRPIEDAQLLRELTAEIDVDETAVELSSFVIHEGKSWSFTVLDSTWVPVTRGKGYSTVRDAEIAASVAEASYRLAVS